MTDSGNKYLFFLRGYAMLLVKRHSLLLASGRMLLNIWHLSVSVHALIELCVKVTHSCLTLCNPMDYTVQGILQVRILEWVVVTFSRGSYQPRDPTHVSLVSGRFFIS